MQLHLYFAPLACSLATRIALYEAGPEATAMTRFVPVDTRAARTLDGADYLTVNPLGQVPALVIEADDGASPAAPLVENAAILQWVARAFPAAGLAPTASEELARLQQWLGFVATELHQAVFGPLLSPRAEPAVKDYARARIPRRFAVLERHLAASPSGFLLDSFSVADAYLLAVLNWTQATAVDLNAWPALATYVQRLRQRPSVSRALAVEVPLYREELARWQAQARDAR